MRRRVVITGMGVVSPIGSELDIFADNLLAGVSGVKKISLFDPAELPTKIAAQVDETSSNYSIKPDGSAKKLRDRKVNFAMVAAKKAFASACSSSEPGDGLANKNSSAPGLSLAIGLELFSMKDLVKYRSEDFIDLPRKLEERLTFLQTPSDICAHFLSEKYGLYMPPIMHISACAAGTDAIGTAFHQIASGHRSWMLAGGADSMINPLGVAGFCKIRATSTSNKEPEKASRPFDKGRNGFVLGEGAGMLILEEYNAAQNRGAKIFAEIIGYGNSLDACEISRPHPEGRGAWQAMKRALDDAGTGPEKVDCICAHGTSTPLNDSTETLAIKKLLGDRAYKIPVCAPKSMFGHLVAAAGCVELIGAILCMRRGQVHPTINLKNPDPLCDLDYVPQKARKLAHHCVLSNSFGFGGHNSAILIRSAN